MPHSSGGGSFSGGVHSSSHSSSSSSSSRRYSSRPFPGALCYVFYDRSYRPHLLYTNEAPETPKKMSWIVYIFLIIMTILPFGVLFFTSYHNPKKLNTNYDTSIVIRDNNEVLSDEEETLLNNKFNEFFDATGITPALVTIDYNEHPYYASLEEYAYDCYVDNFKDEKHWLIVYSSSVGTKKDNWAFEGMQGNDTDSILYESITSKFNNALYNALSESETSLSDALIRSFDEIIPHILDKTFIIEWPILIFTIVWLGFVILFLISQIITALRQKQMKNATPLKGSPILKECPYCGTKYYAETIERCPKCGAIIDYPHIPDTNTNQDD